MPQRVRPVAALIVGIALASSARVPPARAQAVSPIDYGTASRGVVALGVAIATVAELADAPELLARPSSQSFVDDTFARVLAQTNDATLRTHAASTRDDLRAVSGVAFDRDRADTDLARFTRETLHALGVPSDRLCVAGILAEQIRYDARVLRSPADDAQLRKAFGATDVADASVPGLAALRARIAAFADGKWNDIAAAADDAVAAIVGADARPFPASDRVWLVLLRSRGTPADRARRGVPHLWLDVVRFDGTHTSIGAYPGSGDYARDAATMPCGQGRENEAGSEGAVPVPPPVATSSAQLAASLFARCASAPRIAYRVHGASDSRFIVDLLVGASVDAGALLRVNRNASGTK